MNAKLPLVPDAHMGLTFTTKDEYITWRAEWRLRYATLSKYLKDFKCLQGKIASCKALGKAQGVYDRATQEYVYTFIYPHYAELYTKLMVQWEETMKVGAELREVPLLDSKGHKMWSASTQAATRLLEIRKASKAMAQEQYLAAKNMKIAS